jgi:hypothetical protein
MDAAEIYRDALQMFARLQGCRASNICRGTPMRSEQTDQEQTDQV